MSDLSVGIKDVSGLGAVADFAKALLNRVWKDPAEQAKNELAMADLIQSGELQRLATQADLMKGQLEINKIEAASSSLWVSGWRPFFGWVGGASMAWHYIVFPAFVWVAQLCGSTIQPPELDLGDLMNLSLILLGGSYLRTTEKKAGVNKLEPGE